MPSQSLISKVHIHNEQARATYVATMRKVASLTLDSGQWHSSNRLLTCTSKLEALSSFKHSLLPMLLE
uniref:Uncharacterized protein n=1 Tax=Arundo donax TaxID=35708 RepID=A0A0A9C2J8_ARUDO